MSDNNTGRQVAKRVFAQEFNQATYQFQESPDEDRSPKYVLLPTGERANRVFVVGTVTEVQDVGSDSEYWQARIVDPNGDTFFAYAGQYQPDAVAIFRNLEPPAYLAIVGKPRTYETDDGDVNVSLTPESVNVVDQKARDRWVIETAEHTAERIEAFDPEDNQDAQMVESRYEIELEDYKQMVREALRGFEDESAEDRADTADAEDGSEKAESPA